MIISQQAVKRCSVRSKTSEVVTSIGSFIFVYSHKTQGKQMFRKMSRGRSGSIPAKAIGSSHTFICRL
ncbi:MAG: hypothetical protein ACK4QP_21650 [Pseudorhizobium sp.]